MPHTQPPSVVRSTRRGFLTARARTPRPEDYWIRVHRRAMACRFEITLASEDALWVTAARAALNEIDRTEAALSVFQETSVISEVNRRAAAEPVHVDADVFGLLQRCAELCRHTGGAFDITSTPLSRCWGFMRREGRVPSPDEIAAARQGVDATAVRLEPGDRSVRFDRAGLELNLGAIGGLRARSRGRRRTPVWRRARAAVGRPRSAAVGGRRRVARRGHVAEARPARDSLASRRGARDERRGRAVRRGRRPALRPRDRSAYRDGRLAACWRA